MENARPFRLRELWWRARARQLEAWDRAVWLGWVFLSSQCKDVPSFEELHPLRSHMRRRSQVETQTPRARLPKKLSEAEKAEAWETFKRKQHGRG